MTGIAYLLAIRYLDSTFNVLIMNSFVKPYKASACLANASQQTSQSGKPFEDGRAITAFQRGLQENINNRVTQPNAINGVIQRPIRVGTNTLEDPYTKSYEEMLAFQKKIEMDTKQEDNDSDDLNRLSDILKIRKKESKNKAIEYYYFDCDEEGHQATLEEVIKNHNKRVDIQTVNQLMEQFKIVEFDDFEFTCEDEDHKDYIKVLLEQQNPEIKAALVERDRLILNRKELNLEHQITELTADDRDEVIASLKDWLAYARAKEKDHSKAYWALKSQKDDSIETDPEAYYNETSVGGLRSTIKKQHELDSDFSGAASEIKKILEALESLSESFYLVARKNGQVQGLLEKVGKEDGYISNIAINPDNIQPREGKESVKNTLKDLLKSCMALNLETEKKPITLYALSDRVKKIYDHYGFRVTNYKKEELERPTVERVPVGARKWRTHQGYLETHTPKGQQPTEKAKQKGVWKNESNMRISVDQQEKFLKK
ncbi:hypothetical protein [Spirosoma flavum]|uniref:Uncharacterized protein n=1 Tax=Spirosoma flavum TaxID=2048557 RepID=A0ABW6AP87_9BACT